MRKKKSVKSKQKKTIKMKLRKKAGGSNVGKYKGVKSFAGPSGGSPKGSFPINTSKRGKSALKLAHNAPNPAGIKDAVYAKYPGMKPKGNKDKNSFSNGFKKWKNRNKK